jgi:hypothetical protein
MIGSGKNDVGSTTLSSLAVKLCRYCYSNRRDPDPRPESAFTTKSWKKKDMNISTRAIKKILTGYWCVPLP